MTGETEMLMLTATHTATARRSAEQVRRPGLSHAALGLAIASLLPALFWTAVIAGVGHAVGSTPSLEMLALIGSGIAAFLALVVGSVVAR